MAASSLLGSVWNTTNGTKTVTATPSAGDLIVIVTANSGSTTTTANPTDNNSSGTYTLVNTAVKNASADTLQIWVRDALIGAATSTIFTQAPGTTTGGGMAVIRVVGATTAGASAVARSAIQSNQAASTTPAPVLSAVPAAQSTVIGAIFDTTNGSANATPRTGYTELLDAGYNTPTSGIEVMVLDGGETSATITWGSTVPSAWGAVVAEVLSLVVSGLTENFDAALDTTNTWLVTADANTASTVTAGQLVQTHSSTSITAQQTVVLSRKFYSLFEDSTYLKLDSVSFGSAVAGGEVGYVMDGGGGNQLVFASTSAGALVMGYRIANVWTQVANITYDAAAHAWLRFKHTGTTISWDTAARTASNPPISTDWTNRGTLALSTFTPGIGAFNDKIYAYADQNVGAITAKWDALNTSATVPGIALDASLAGASALTAALSTQITPAASLAALTTVTAGLTTAIRPAASLAGGTSLTAGLTTSITPAANLGAVSTVSAALTTAIPLAAGLSGVTTLTGSMATPGAALAASAGASSTVSAALTTAIQMAASLIGAASASADLTAGEVVLEAGRLGGFVIDKTDSALWWKRKPKKISEPVARQKIAKVAERLAEVAQQAQQPTQKAAHAAIAPLLVSMPGFDWTALYRVIVAQENARRAHEQAQQAIAHARRAWEQDEEDALILLMTH